MGFAANAIGFYLQMEDQMSPTLKSADKGYGRFVKSLEGWNKKAFKAAKHGMDALAKHVESWEALPKKATKAYDDATKAVRKKVKPIEQPMTFTVKGRDRDNFIKSMTTALQAALSKAKIKMSAVVPAKRSKIFDTSVPLRQLYKKVPQPPDFAGSLSLPKYAKGRMPKKVVAGAGPKIDDQIAVLAKDELVVPGDAANKILSIAGQVKSASGQFATLPKDFAENLARAENLLKAAPIHAAMFKSGMDPKGMKKYGKAVDEVDKIVAKLGKDMKGLHTTFKSRMAPVLADLKNQAHDAAGATTVLEKAMLKLLGPAKFIAGMEVLKKTGALIGSVSSAVLGVGGLGDASQNIVTSFDDMQRVLHLTDAEFTVFRKRFETAMAPLPKGATNMQQLTVAFDHLLKLGTNQDAAMKMSASVDMFSHATGTALDMTAQLSYNLENNLGVSAENVTSSLATLQKSAKGLSVDMNPVIASLNEFGDANQQLLTNMGPDAAKKTIESLGKLTIAGEAAQKGLGTGLAQIISQALSDPSKMAALASTLGKNPQDVAAMLASGDVGSLLQGLQGRFTGASQYQINATANAFGVDPKVLTGLSNKADQVTKSMTAMAGATTDAANAQQSLAGAVQETRQGLVERPEAAAKDVLSRDTGVDLGAQAAQQAGGWLQPIANVAETIAGYVGLKKLAGLFKGGGGAGGGGIGGAIRGAGGWIGKMFGKVGGGLGRLGGFLGNWGSKAAGLGGRMLGGLGGYASAALGPIGLLLGTEGSLGGDEYFSPTDPLAGLTGADRVKKRGQMGVDVLHSTMQSIYEQEHPFANWMKGWYGGGADLNDPDLMLKAQAKIEARRAQYAAMPSTTDIASVSPAQAVQTFDEIKDALYQLVDISMDHLKLDKSRTGSRQPINGRRDGPSLGQQIATTGGVDH